MDRLTGDGEGLAHRLLDAFGDDLGFELVADRRADHQELVAAESTDEVAVAHPKSDELARRILDTLAKKAPFEGHAESDLVQLVAAMAPVEFKAGIDVLREGETGDLASSPHGNFWDADDLGERSYYDDDHGGGGLASGSGSRKPFDATAEKSGSSTSTRRRRPTRRATADPCACM